MLLEHSYHCLEHSYHFVVFLLVHSSNSTLVLFCLVTLSKPSFSSITTAPPGSSLFAPTRARAKTTLISNTMQMLTVCCYFTRSHRPLLDRAEASSDEPPQSAASWVTYSDVAVAAPSSLPRRLSDKRPISCPTPTDIRTPSSTSTKVPLAQPFFKPTVLHRDMFFTICLIRSTWISGILSSYYA